LIKAWKEALLEDETANLVIVPEKKAGTKRKVVRVVLNNFPTHFNDFFFLL